MYPGFRSEHDKRSLQVRPCSTSGGGRSGAPERHPEVGLLVEHIQRVRVAFWGLLRGLLAALDHALDPSIRHPLLALNVQRRDVVPAASTPTELGIQPIGLADSDLRPSNTAPASIRRFIARLTCARSISRSRAISA